MRLRTGGDRRTKSHELSPPPNPRDEYPWARYGSSQRSGIRQNPWPNAGSCRLATGGPALQGSAHGACGPGDRLPDRRPGRNRRRAPRGGALRCYAGSPGQRGHCRRPDRLRLDRRDSSRARSSTSSSMPARPADGASRRMTRSAPHTAIGEVADKQPSGSLPLALGPFSLATWRWSSSEHGGGGCCRQPLSPSWRPPFPSGSTAHHSRRRSLSVPLHSCPSRHLRSGSRRRWKLHWIATVVAIVLAVGMGIRSARRIGRPAGRSQRCGTPSRSGRPGARRRALRSCRR